MAQTSRFQPRLELTHTPPTLRQRRSCSVQKQPPLGLALPCLEHLLHQRWAGTIGLATPTNSGVRARAQACANAIVAPWRITAAVNVETPPISTPPTITKPPIESALIHPLQALPCGSHQFSIGHGKDRKSTRLNSSHVAISYAVFFLK